MMYIGIDPGKDGAFAFIDNGTVFTGHWDRAEFIHSMRIVSTMDEKIVCLEKVGSMPGQGVKSMFSFGKSAGFIEGVLEAFEIPYQLVSPQTWKKEFGLNASKQTSIEVCKRLYPGVNLFRTERCRKEHDGMAEALLMALYAKRKL